jgi:hypothetical protein
MLVKEMVDRFKKKRPVCLMARMALARLLSPEAIDQVFYEHAVEQYERKIPFSALTELMTEVTLCLSPSVNAAYIKNREKLAAARHHCDTPAVSIGQPETALGRGHLQQFRRSVRDGGWSILSKSTLDLRAGGLVDRCA